LNQVVNFEADQGLPKDRPHCSAQHLGRYRPWRTRVEVLVGMAKSERVVKVPARQEIAIVAR
jgi:hypothetical protein